MNAGEVAKVKAATEQLLKTVELVMYLLGISRRDVERKLGWHAYYFNRIVSGEIAVRFEHVVGFATALEMTVTELFALAFPLREPGRSAGFLKVQGVVWSFLAGPVAGPPIGSGPPD